MSALVAKMSMLQPICFHLDIFVFYIDSSSIYSLLLYLPFYFLDLNLFHTGIKISDK